MNGGRILNLPPMETTMDDKNKKLNILFAPGCFDSFEGTQEELDELVAEILAQFDNDDVWENCIPLEFDDLEDDLDQEPYQITLTGKTRPTIH